MNRELGLAIALAAATLLWNLYGFAGNFFEHYWGGPGMPVVLVSYLVNALLLAGVALVGIRQLPAVSFLVVAGLVMAAWSLVGVVVEIGVAFGSYTRTAAPPPLNLPQPSPLLGPLVPMLTGVLTAALAWRAGRGQLA